MYAGCPQNKGGKNTVIISLCGKAVKLFPTCQVRVARFYVSVSRLLPPASSSSSSSSSSSCDRVSSVWRAGPQPRSCEFNRDRGRPVWRAGPQPRSWEVSVACRTSTAIMGGECGVPDLNRDHGRPALRAGPQPRSWEANVACRTSTAIM